MTSIAFCGLRGGAGVTSIVAATGAAMRAMGATVLMIDLSATNLLRLHFGMPYADRCGWARTILDKGSWCDAAREVEPGLDLLPFGRLSRPEHKQVPALMRSLLEHRIEPFAMVTSRYDMVLIDVPADCYTALPFLAECTLLVIILEADPASCVILADRPQSDCCHYLISRYDPLSCLQRDIRLLWQQQLHDRLIPLAMHRDESVAEAMAQKQPVSVRCPHSLAASDAVDLAAWCMDRPARGPGVPTIVGATIPCAAPAVTLKMS